MEPILSARDVSFAYDNYEEKKLPPVVLEDISLDVQPGEFVAVLGHNGSGKSTLAKHFNAILLPTSGTVYVGGIDTKEEDRLYDIRQTAGMVFQNPDNQLVATIVEEDVAFALENLGVPPEEIRRRVDESLKAVGMYEYREHSPHQLSGGQKQRVAIARALATNPKVLLCDEATSALDPTTTQSILALLQELNRTLGVTVVIITHEMKVVEQICGRVAILSESHVVEEGKVSEVFRHPKTAAARQLLMPGSETARKSLVHGRAYRITFDGSTAEQPVVSGMVLSCGEPVNILFADMKNIDGKTYGQMLLQLPENEGSAARMLAYLESQHIAYSEEEVK